jgi:hypothetical protein
MTKAVILARVSTVKQEKATLIVPDQAELLGRLIGCALHPETENW